MWLIGVVLLIVAVGLFFTYKSQKQKLGLMEGTETKDIAFLQEWSERVSTELGQEAFDNQLTEVKGTIECNNPLHSELAGVECVYYDARVTREYEETYYERDEDGVDRKRTRRGSDTMSSNQRSTPFYLNDGTGTIRIEPTGAEMVTEKVLSQFENHGRGDIRVGGFNVAYQADRGNRRTLGYRFEERAIVLNRQLYILGAATVRNRELAIVNADEKGQFIISIKSEEELSKSKESTALWSMIGAIICSIGGVALIIMGLQANA